MLFALSKWWNVKLAGWIIPFIFLLWTGLIWLKLAHFRIKSSSRDRHKIKYLPFPRPSSSTLVSDDSTATPAQHLSVRGFHTGLKIKKNKKHLLKNKYTGHRSGLHTRSSMKSRQRTKVTVILVAFISKLGSKESMGKEGECRYEKLHKTARPVACFLVSFQFHFFP